MPEQTARPEKHQQDDDEGQRDLVGEADDGRRQLLDGAEQQPASTAPTGEPMPPRMAAAKAGSSISQPISGETTVLMPRIRPATA
jgi:hypothetical protein